MKHLGDITKVNGAEIEPVDVLVFGSPCQDLSIAGSRSGLSGERSGLFLEAIRIIKEMRAHEQSSGRSDEHIRPRFAIFENVKGIFSSNNGEDFRTVLEKFIHIKDESVTIPRPQKKWGGQDSFVEMITHSLGEFLMLNIGASPNEERDSHLSWILQINVPEKYCLSPKACQGILNRASRRGKALPHELRIALENVVANAILTP